MSGLTSAEGDQFRAEGYLGPLELCSADAMAPIRERIETEVLTTEGPASNVFQSRHMDQRVIYDLCAHPAIAERMASLYGPDLVLWRSHMFCKERGAKEVPWHQDMNYWPLEPLLNISAWIAIDEATVENACVQVLPGSHKGYIPHVAAGSEMMFKEMADPERIDTSKAVPIEMRPGEFFLFNEKCLHRSAPNTSDKRRLGLAVRVTIPLVKVDHDRLFPGHANIVMRGRDTMGLNRVVDPPGD